MNYEILIPILSEIGANKTSLLVKEKINGIGGDNVDDLLFAIARRIGSSDTPEGIVSEYKKNPDNVKAIVLSIEAEGFLALTAKPKQESFFEKGWRPSMSWLLIWMVMLNSTFIPFINAFMAINIQSIPWDQIIAFSGIWLVIYGGGNTALRIFGDKKQEQFLNTVNEKNPFKTGKEI